MEKVRFRSLTVVRSLWGCHHVGLQVVFMWDLRVVEILDGCGGLYLVGNSIKVAVLALVSCVRRGVICYK
jgi:hypothetical protein